MTQEQWGIKQTIIIDYGVELQAYGPLFQKRVPLPLACEDVFTSFIQPDGPFNSEGSFASSCKHMLNGS